jgi:HlyD family secretion protein
MSAAINAPIAAAPATSRLLAPVSQRNRDTNLLSVRPYSLLDAPTPRTRMPIILGFLIFLVFVVGFGAWAMLAPLAEASIAPGTIKVEGSRRTIQHLEGGIVRKILAHDGSQVKAGDVLVQLDTIQSATAVDTQRVQRWTLLAQDARLTAELSGAGAITFPNELKISVNPHVMEAVDGQRALFEARAANLNSQVQVLQARVDQQQAVIAGARGQLAATRHQLAFAKQEEDMRRGLFKQGLGRLPELLAIQRAVAALDGSAEDLNGQIDRADAMVLETRKQIQATVDQRMQEAATNQHEIRLKLAEVEEKLRAAADIADRRGIVAPEDGTLLNQKVFTVGAVLRPGDPVFDLIPKQDRLIAEVNIQATDIASVHPDLEAQVRLPAFKQRLVPFLRGQVTWVAADATIDEQTHHQFYRAHILIDQGQLVNLPHVFLASGMPVEAHICVGHRTFFRYITQPIHDSFARAFEEK